MSQPISDPAAPAAAAQKPRRGVLRFLFKTPLGWVGMLLALLGALVLAAPWIAEGIAAQFASDWFAKRYRGQLSIEKLDLGWRGPQTIEGIELADPDGARVARMSVRLPGMWSLAKSGGKRLGKIEALGEATLVADALGVTNLDRALEPRETAPVETEEEERAASKRSSESSGYDAELDLRMTRIGWADENTRALGAPFTLENLGLSVMARPEQPLTARLRATLTGSAKGAVSLDARIEHPFEPPSSSTPPRAEINASIEHLPVALVDALARQGGRLQTLLGEELSLGLDAKGTLQQGSFELRLDAPRGRVRASARVADGVLRSEDEGIALELDVHQEFIDSLVRPLLESGASLARSAPPAGASPANGALRFALSSFEAPLGAYFEAAANGRSQAGLEALLSGVRANFTAQLGDWSCSGASALGSSGALFVRGLRLSGACNAPGEDSTLELRCQARSGGDAASTAGFGTATVSVLVPGGASLALFAPGDALARVQLAAKFEEVPTALFDSLAQTRGDLGRMLGAKLALIADLSLSLAAAGQKAQAPSTWAEASARWREVAARASAEASLRLTGTPSQEPVGLLGGERLSLSLISGGAKLAPGAPLDLHAQAVFESSGPGNLDLQLSLGDLLADPASKTPLRFSLGATAAGLPTAVADALAHSGQDLQQLLGPVLVLNASAQGTLESGVVEARLSGEGSNLTLSGRLADGVFSNPDQPALRVMLQPDSEFLERRAAAFLPSGARLGFVDGGRGLIALDVDSLVLPVAGLLEAASQPADALLRTALSQTRCEIGLILRELVFEDSALLATGQRIDQLAISLGLSLRPGEPSSPLSIECKAHSPSFGSEPVHLHVDVPDAPELLGIAVGGNFAPITVRLEATRMPTALLDVYAGGMLREALGSTLDLSLDARVAQAEAAPFDADTTLSISAAGGQSTLIFKAQVKDPLNLRAKAPAVARSPGVAPELEAMVDVSGAGVLLSFAPAGARELLRELCGETIAARVKLAESTPGSARASISLDAGSLQLRGAADYTDKILTTIAAEPLVLRIQPPPALLERLLAKQLPAGAKLELAGSDAVLLVQLEKLRAPLDRYFAADPSLALAELVENLDGHLDAQFPAFTYTHPPAAAGAQPSVVQLRDVRLSARMQAGAPANLDLTGAIDATPPGQLQAHVVVEKPAGFTASAPAAFPAPGSRATLNAKLERFPSALLDVIAQQEGLIVDVLGPELAAEVSGSYPALADEPLRAKLRSNLGDVSLVSNLSDGVITSSGEQGLDAKVGLTPLFTQRIVGSLLPMLVQVRQDDPSKRALITGRNLALPLDADLSKLSGEILLDLGAVNYQLLPGLDRAFALAGAAPPSMKNTVIKPIAIQITNGVARYERIPITIAGHELAFGGSADLAKHSFELGCKVPLSMLGSGVESQLDALRKVLDPKLEVPLEFYGSWSSPRMRLGKGFLEKTIKDAGKGALKGELEKGLGGLLGGKKKPKDG